MTKRVVIKAASCCLATMFVIASNITTVEAGALLNDMPGAGITTVLSTTIETTDKEAEKDPQVSEAEVPVVENEYADIAIAQVTNYVNLRSEPSEEGEILGKLYNNSAATVLEVAGDWYKIKSGNVDGFVKAEFVVTGEAAAQLAEQVGHRIATVNTETLKVRNNPGLDATVQTLIPFGEEYEVVEDQGEWVKIAVDTDVEGFVSAEFVDLKTEFVEAESIEEEKARLEAEAARIREAEEAARKADAASKKKTDTSGDSGVSASTSVSEVPAVTAPANGSRASVVSYALQFVGNPYVAGGTSLTNGADCSGFTSSVFRDMGVSIPRDSRSQAAAGRAIDIGSVQPGDLLFYSNGSTINHVALYIGNGQVVHSSTPRTGIKISSYNYRQPCKAVSYLN